MSTSLEWIAAVGAVIAAAGGLAGWLSTARARMQLRAETIRNGQDRRENELHRQRFAEVWNWQREQPGGDERVQAARWFGEWTGASRPYRGGKDSPPQTPGLHSPDFDDAYDRYIEFLAAVYQPGRLGPPRERLELPGEI
jgi:hypothetical protein